MRIKLKIQRTILNMLGFIGVALMVPSIVVIGPAYVVLALTQYLAKVWGLRISHEKWWPK